MSNNNTSSNSSQNSNQEQPRKSNNLLDAANLISLFKHHKPTFRNGCDAIVAALHVLMKELGFKCVGVFESEQIDATANTKFLPDGWNQSTEFYSLRYKHPQSSMTFVIKSIVIGEMLLINASALEDKTVHGIEVQVSDHINKQSPLDDYITLYKNLQSFVEKCNSSIITKLVPSLQMEGYSSQKSSNVQSTSSQSPQPSQPSQPSQPQPSPAPSTPYSDYDDDYYNSPLREGPRGGGGFVPAPSSFDPYSTPFGMGGNDLYPFGRGSIVPPMPGPGSGNLIGPSHPGFGPSVTDPYAPYGFGGGRGRRGYGRGSVPPGARFDPYGPPTGGFGPDPDDLPPPGYGGFI